MIRVAFSIAVHPMTFTRRGKSAASRGRAGAKLSPRRVAVVTHVVLARTDVLDCAVQKSNADAHLNLASLDGADLKST